MKTEDFLIYSILFLAGALALFVLQKLMAFMMHAERRSFPNTMDTRLIRQMVDEYRNNHLDVINKTLGLDDAHSVSFSLRILKKFVTDIEYQTKKHHPGIGIDALGIRFYYAAYPKENEWQNLENDKAIGRDSAQKHTLIMIPTLKKKSRHEGYLDYDFNPLNPATYAVTEYQKEQPVAMMAMDTDDRDNQSYQVMAQNHGQTIPPADSGLEAY